MPVISISYIKIIKRWGIKMYGSNPRVRKDVLKFKDFYIDPIGYQVKLGQMEIDLTLKEFELLYLFISKRGMVVRRSDILQSISTPDQLNKYGAVNVEICRLRKKIEADSHRPKRLVSVRGIGYRLK
jgi:DNA-binding response OmpR family regulator